MRIWGLGFRVYYGVAKAGPFLALFKPVKGTRSTLSHPNLLL